MKDVFSLKCIILLFYLLPISYASAQIELSPLFSDNMVLQQQSEVPIWGNAKANSMVNVTTSWNKKNYTAKADTSGRWTIKVETPSAGGPHEITISNKKSIKLKNVMIGEVWICSGQSNMEMPLAGWGKILDYENEIAKANYPNIRLLQVEKKMSIVPLSNINVAGGSWQQCSPTTIAEFSSTAYFFGRQLHQQLNVPIGLIHTSWGGTVAEAWTSSQSLQMMPDFRDAINSIKDIPTDPTERNRLYETSKATYFNKLMEADFGYQNQQVIAASVDYDDSEWKNMRIPTTWESADLPDFDGFVWFRKTLEIPAKLQGKDLVLSLGTIDDNDITFVNGIEVGRKEGWHQKRRYHVPKQLTKTTKIVITVRVTDTGGGGGLYGDNSDLYIALAADESNSKSSLVGDWKYKVALAFDQIPFPKILSNDANNPTFLYNAMINPLVPYSIKGAIWYQGEANEARAYQYKTLFPLMINDWRTKWNNRFPFYFAQLSNYRQQDQNPVDSDWAELREAQLQALHLENTGMAVTIDIGNADDIHPKNKQEVGRRLALNALAKTYKQNIAYSGPIYQSYTIEGNTIRLSFTNTHGGLKSTGKLTAFSIAGVDKKFYWADAKIEGNDIIVSSAHVLFPIAVRYAWANNPNANLLNGADLPASPFRTDSWRGISEK